MYSQIPGLNVDLLKKTMTDEILKFFLKKEQLIILYTPSEMALAGLDIAMSLQLEQDGSVNPALSDFGGDLTRFFPEVEISTWDKVGELKKEIKEYKGAEVARANKIRAEI